ncbi:MAG: hypothetical protein GKR89_25295 [Candidatus Latescibacteria bacterium]|nr:hypothetical protein [Candidatus Latescibacterota bacterium]
MQNAEPTPDLAAQQRHHLGLVIFLVSLAVLFAASLVGYIITRLAMPEGSVDLPAGLWFSTVLLLLSGLTIHKTQTSLHQDQFTWAHRWLKATFALSLAFLIVQAPCVLFLLESHWRVLNQENFGGYGLVLALIAIHALHVIGGMVPLAWQTYRAHFHGLSRAQAPNLRSCALYWHFLDGVWLIMFALFLLTD